MPILETAAVKALGPLSKLAPRTIARLENWIIKDHSAIAGLQTLGHPADRFRLTVAVGPSRAVKRLGPRLFTQHAYACAQWIFDGQPFKVDYSGSDLVRCVVPDPAAVPGTRGDLHAVRISPTGLVRLDWGLDASVADSKNVQLSLDEIVDVLVRMYRFGHSPTYHALYQTRRTERFQRLDWRVGLTPSVVSNDGPIPWAGLTASGRPPATRNEHQIPWCPMAGYGADRLNSVKYSTPAAQLFHPALEQLMVDAGYIGIEDSVADALAGLPARELPSPDQPAIGGVGHES